MTPEQDLALLQAAISIGLKAYHAYEAAKTGKTDPDAVHASFVAGHAALDANNATIDAEIAARFP